MWCGGWRGARQCSQLGWDRAGLPCGALAAAAPAALGRTYYTSSREPRHGRTARVPARRGALTEHRAGRRQIGNAFARTVCVRYASVKAPARLSKFPRARAGYSLHAIERFVGAWTIACSGAGRLARLNSVFPFSPPPLRDKLLAPAIVYLRGHNACCSCCRGARPLSQLLLPCAYGRYHSCSISTRCFPCALLLLLPKRSLHLLPPLDHAPRLAPVVELHAHLHHPKL